MQWPNRVPIEEKGGVNLGGVVNNCSITEVDILGLKGMSLSPQQTDAIRRSLRLLRRADYGSLSSQLLDILSTGHINIEADYDSITLGRVLPTDSKCLDLNASVFEARHDSCDQLYSITETLTHEYVHIRQYNDNVVSKSFFGAVNSIGWAISLLPGAEGPENYSLTEIMAYRLSEELTKAVSTMKVNCNSPCK